MKLKNKYYDILKWVSMICIPALVVFLNVVLPAWNVPVETTTRMVTTVGAVGTLLGALIGVSSANYKKDAE